MLPKVAAAISQFIKPVSSTKGGTPEDSPKLNQFESKLKESKADLKLVVNNEELDSQDSHPNQPNDNPEHSENLLNLAKSERVIEEKKTIELAQPKKPNAMVTLFQTLKSPGQLLARKIRVIKNYSGGQNKKKMNTKKGVIVDDQIF